MKKFLALTTILCCNKTIENKFKGESKKRTVEESIKLDNLVLAIEYDDYKLFSEYLKELKNLNQLVNEEGSLLHIAVKKGNKKIITLLLHSNIDVSLKNSSGKLAHELASEDIEQIIKKYIEFQEKGNDYKILVVYAIKENNLELLKDNLNKLKDIDELTEEGTLLHTAAIFGNVATINALLTKEPNPFIKNKEEKFAYTVAKPENKEIIRKYTKEVQMLKALEDNQKNITFLISRDVKPLEYIYIPLKDILNKLENREEYFELNSIIDYKHLIFKAFEEENIELIKSMIISAKSQSSLTSVTQATQSSCFNNSSYNSFHGHNNYRGSVFDNANSFASASPTASGFINPSSSKSSSTSFTSNLDINCANSEGDTLLILASQNGYKEIVELLLDKGAKIDTLNKENNNASSLAVSNGHEEIVRLLRIGSKATSSNVETSSNVNSKAITHKSRFRK